MSKPKICVVGASNIDLVSYAPKLPKLGETVPGTKFEQGFGGKGANQAVMAAKLGADVSMITKLGNDIFGKDYLDNYRLLGFDTNYILFTDDASTGIASIWVDEESGDNAIIVAPGANGLLLPSDVGAAKEAITRARIVLCQWEIPLESAIAALQIGREAGVTTFFNVAPANGPLPDEAYPLCDILCANESETETLTNISVNRLPEAEAAARVLLERGVGNVILTLGERGSILVNEQIVSHATAPEVDAIDTTGAGDAFCGSLAHFLASDVELADAIVLANQVAAVTVQSEGAQTSFPDRHDLPSELL